ncbi:ABC-2 family transporter protein [Lactobacillus delbrueckii]|uniref:ABC-2 family transporter protein n=1 Tax=Lactobacillus delbrueckii TaxID=1584 RepID=UPI0021681C59|nr:ABC-2 family transporter protein [Lactobacillus delbrueckii]
MRKIKAIWRQSLAEFMIYRGTSIITFLLATVFLLIELLAGQVYFSQRENLAGWTANRYYVMISFMNSATYLYNLFFILGHEGLGEDILEGNLDYLLVRPSSSYWLAVGRSLDIPSFFNLLLSLGLLAYYLTREGASFGQIMLINCMIVLPAALIFILNQLCLTLLFWFEGLTALGGIVEDFWLA